MIEKYIVIFLMLFVTDAIWALYIRWTADGKAFKAASSSVFIYAVGAITFAEFIKDPYVLIPAGLGCFLGTLATMKWFEIWSKNK